MKIHKPFSIVVSTLNLYCQILIQPLSHFPTTLCIHHCTITTKYTQNFTIIPVALPTIVIITILTLHYHHYRYYYLHHPCSIPICCPRWPPQEHCMDQRWRTSSPQRRTGRSSVFPLPTTRSGLVRGSRGWSTALPVMGQ